MSIVTFLVFELCCYSLYVKNKPKNSDNSEINLLEEYFGTFIAKVLISLGIKTLDEAKSFLEPDFNGLKDPFLINGMQVAVDRIYKAVKDNEKVLIYSDYDCDGIPASIVMKNLLDKIGFTNYKNYIPDRQDEGYGLNPKAIDFIIENKFSLVVTIDLGISEMTNIKTLKDANIDVVVIDHHEQHDELPPAFVIIDPKKHEDKYEFKGMCACGLVFKFVQAFLFKHREEFDVAEGWEKWLLDLVAISTLADQVPLVGENRILAYFGLIVLRKTKRPGLKALMQVAKIDPQNITEEDISFAFAPRINATSRLASPHLAFNLLACDNEQDAIKYAIEIETLNKNRKTMVATAVKQAINIVGENNAEPVLVIGNPNWRIGILGLIASRISEMYKKTVFAWGRADSEIIRGSCRSIGDIHLVDLMSDARDVFEEYGGHEMAGGFSVNNQNIFLLKDKLILSYEKVSENKAKKEDKVNYDDKNLHIILAEDVNDQTHKSISKLSPFGCENPKPVFIIKNANVRSINYFGKSKEHIRIEIFDGNKTVSCYQFFKTEKDFSVLPKIGEKISIKGTIEKSTFGYNRKIEIRIVDVI